jgi:hypothetical protein
VDRIATYVVCSLFCDYTVFHDVDIIGFVKDMEGVCDKNARSVGERPIEKALIEDSFANISVDSR